MAVYFCKIDMSSVTHDEVASSKAILSGPRESRDFPDWFREQQREAWEQFQSLPKPTRKDQLWRFASVDLLDLAPFKIPAPLSDAQAADVRRLALAAFKAIDGAGMARVDFLLAGDSGVLYLNEVNTIPGFTTISMYSKLWAASAIRRSIRLG